MDEMLNKLTMAALPPPSIDYAAVAVAPAAAGFAQAERINHITTRIDSNCCGGKLGFC